MRGTFEFVADWTYKLCEVLLNLLRNCKLFELTFEFVADWTYKLCEVLLNLMRTCKLCVVLLNLLRTGLINCAKYF